MKKILIICISVITFGCTAMADKPIAVVEQVPVNNPINISKEEKLKPVFLDKVIVFMEEGSVIGVNRQGIFCLQPRPRIWGDSQAGVWVSGQYHEIFDSILKENNIEIPVMKSESLFSDYKPSGNELVVRAKISEIKENFCSAIGDQTFNKPAQTVYKGSVKFSVNWEIYSLSEKKVVYKSITEGSSIGEKFVPLGEHHYYQTAFGNALKNLLAKQDFIDVLKFKNTNQTKL